MTTRATGQKSYNCQEDSRLPVADMYLSIDDIYSFCQEGTDMKIICKVCGKEAIFYPSRGNPKYCSFDCYTNYRKANTIPDEEYIKRFWDKVEIKSNEECWNWVGWENNSGYGYLHIRQDRLEAHRYSYELAYGNILDGLHVLHKCDNRLCVNPAHLFLGTKKDNMQDMVKKGRSGFGERNSQSKLTQEQVLNIKREYINGLKSAKGQHWVRGNGDELAKKYGISIYHLRNIIYGQRWGWLSDG